MSGSNPCLIFCSPILIPCMIIEECCKIYCCLICCCNYPETNKKTSKKDQSQVYPVVEQVYPVVEQVYPVVEVESYENIHVSFNEEIKESS